MIAQPQEHFGRGDIHLAILQHTYGHGLSYPYFPQFLLTLCALLVCCGYAQGQVAEFRSYSGSSVAPMAPRATIDGRFQLPLYYGLPSQPYRILGTVIVHGNIDGSPIQDGDVFRSAVKTAKAHGAEAIILLPINPNHPVQRFAKGRQIVLWASAIQWKGREL